MPSTNTGSLLSYPSMVSDDDTPTEVTPGTRATVSAIC
jgi:hypothetical protein